MFHLSKVIAVLIALFFFIGCDDEQKENLPGEWVFHCQPVGMHAASGEMTFLNGKVSAEGYLFENLACDTKTVKVEYEGAWATGEAVGMATEINFYSTKFQLTLLRDDVVAHYNNLNICGISNWKLDEPRSVIGASNCVGVYPPEVQGEPGRDLFYINGEGTLMFAAFPLSFPSVRPQAISNSVIKFYPKKEN